MSSYYGLYGLAFFSALVLSLILTPAARSAALVLDIFDKPTSHIKTHKEATPYLGGLAIFLAFTLTLLWIRVLTSFPTGTLRALRGLLIGGSFILAVGLADDIKLKGLHYRTKFVLQISAAIIVMMFGIHLNFIKPLWLGYFFSVLWIVGITNACNLTDIMDGLASSIIFIASLAFLFISFPTEKIYVNFAAASLAGATLGFIPYNLSKGHKIFMGDSGSLFIGFIAGSLALGTSYSTETNWGVFAPLLILAIPIFDTAAVFILRIRRGKSPFLGSKDHFPLRLEMLGWTRPQIRLFAILATAGFSLGAFLVTRLSSQWAIIIYALFILSLIPFTIYILKAKVK